MDHIKRLKVLLDFHFLRTDPNQHPFLIFHILAIGVAVCILHFSSSGCENMYVTGIGMNIYVHVLITEKSSKTEEQKRTRTGGSESIDAQGCIRR